MVSVTITYRQPGTQPPIYVAGSFSDPQWQPLEMQFTTDDAGEHTFYKDVEVPPGSQIQYKFRVGPGDWWVLNEDAATVTDDAGNRNNLLTAPATQESTHTNGVKAGDQSSTEQSTKDASPTADMDASTAAQPEPKPKALEIIKDEERKRLSSTPIEQVADTAAEVADTAQKLDAEDNVARLTPLDHLKDGERQRLSSTPIEQVASTAAEVADTAQQLDADQDFDATDDGAAPLFSHEALGPYEPAGSDEEDDRKHEDHGTVVYDVSKYDLNDPSLERLPSNRDGIMDAVRKVETGRNEDQTHFHGTPLSPLVGPRKASMDPYEEAVVSPGPSSPGHHKKLELPRRSHGSMTSERSLASLGSIAEEEGKDSAGVDEATREEIQPVRVPSPAIRPTPNIPTSPASDEDEGVVMKGSKSNSKKKTEFATADTPEVNGNTNGVHSRDLSPMSKPAQLDSPTIQIQPPEEAAESSNSQDASASGRDGVNKGQLKKRGGASSVERPGTPSSIHSVAGSKGGWLQAFFRVVFVDWIGGIFSRLFGSKRKAMLTTSTAAIVVGVAWWKYALDGDLTWLEAWL